MAPFQIGFLPILAYQSHCIDYHCIRTYSVEQSRCPLEPIVRCSICIYTIINCPVRFNWFCAIIVKHCSCGLRVHAKLRISLLCIFHPFRISLLCIFHPAALINQSHIRHGTNNDRKSIAIKGVYDRYQFFNDRNRTE